MKKIVHVRDDINSNKLDNGGQKPLSFAASNRPKEAGRVVHGWDDVNHNKPQQTGYALLNSTLV